MRRIVRYSRARDKIDCDRRDSRSEITLGSARVSRAGESVPLWRTL